MKKINFYINVRNNNGVTYEEKSGYAMDFYLGSEFAFTLACDKRNNFWYETEITTGRSIFGNGFKTRKELFEFYSDERFIQTVKSMLESEQGKIMQNNLLAYKNRERILK